MTISSHLRRVGWAGALALTALFGSAGASSAASYTVLNNGSAGADTLQAAIAAAQADSDASDTITFDPSVTGTISTGGTELVLSKDITITGPGAGVLTIDGGGTGRVFHVTAGTVLLSGLRLTNGVINGDTGGGLRTEGGSNVTLENMTVDHCTSNSAGGGLANEDTLTVLDSTFSTNSGPGGAVYNDGSASFAGCTFANNTANGSVGGAVYCAQSANLTNCTLTGNSAYQGGAIYANATVTLTSCTLTGNSAASGQGGGLWGSYYQTSVLTACIVANNSGGNFYAEVDSWSGQTGHFNSGGSNLIGDGDEYGFSNGNNHDQTGVSNPMLGSLADNGGPTQTLRPQAGSPALNADYSGVTANDQRGIARTAAQHTIGAVEGAGPATVADSYSVAKNGTLTVLAASGLLANDVDAPGATLTANLVSGPGHGTLTLNADGSFVYTPTSNYSGSDSFTYAASDADGTGNTATVTLTVTPPAVVLSSIAITPASASISTQGTQQFTATATYSDSSTADVTSMTTWASSDTGKATISSAGLASGVASGMVNITATLSGVTSNSAVLTLNAPPAANADSYTTAENQALIVAAPGILANDSSSTGAPLTAHLVSGPGHGTLTLNADGSFVYTPTSNYSGSDSFTYAASDVTGTGNTATVTLTVTHVPATLVVTNNLDDGSVGSLRSVLASAGPGDTVTFASNVTGTITLMGTQIPISQDVTIVGPGAGVLTIDAGGVSRIFNISSGTVSISGLTLANGKAIGDFGGAISNAGILTVTACVFQSNSADYSGGAIFNTGSASLTLADDTFLSNSAVQNGGAVFNGSGAAARITSSTFSGSTANNGGALYNFGILVVVNSTVVGSTAGYGGAILNTSAMVLTNDTFADNTATTYGVIYDVGTTTVTASIFTGSFGGEFLTSGQLTSGGSNIVDDSDGNGFTNGVNHDQTGVSAATANLGPLASNGGPTQTLAVLAGSPAIGGDYAALTATDQRGVARTAAQHTIGAFEYAAPPAPVLHTHVLWNNADGRVMLWSIAPDGTRTENTFGPYTDDGTAATPWYAKAIATGPDGLSHILWTNPDGRVILWTVDDNGSFTYQVYGPYTDDGTAATPWNATALSVGADNIVHILWNNPDGRVILWNVDSGFNFTLGVFGPYNDDGTAATPWSATALATGPDNVTRVVWNNPDGRVILWNVDHSFNFSYQVYGPYDDGQPNTPWSASAVSVGGDNVTHLLWTNPDNRFILWNLDASFHLSYGVFGPYTDGSVSTPWGAAALATGPDGLSHLLWTNPDNRVILWDVDSTFNFTYNVFGPYTDGSPNASWSATAISAGP